MALCCTQAQRALDREQRKQQPPVVALDAVPEVKLPAAEEARADEELDGSVSKKLKTEANKKSKIVMEPKPPTPQVQQRNKSQRKQCQ